LVSTAYVLGITRSRFSIRHLLELAVAVSLVGAFYVASLNAHASHENWKLAVSRRAEERARARELKLATLLQTLETAFLESSDEKRAQFLAEWHDSIQPKPLSEIHDPLQRDLYTLYTAFFNSYAFGFLPRCDPEEDPLLANECLVLQGSIDYCLGEFAPDNIRTLIDFRPQISIEGHETVFFTPVYREAIEASMERNIDDEVMQRYKFLRPKMWIFPGHGPYWELLTPPAVSLIVFNEDRTEAVIYLHTEVGTVRMKRSGNDSILIDSRFGMDYSPSGSGAHSNCYWETPVPSSIMPDWHLPITDSAPMSHNPRILIVRLTAIGDVLHTLPVLCALRNHLPGAEIGWMVEGRAGTLLEGHPALDRLIRVPRKWLKSPSKVWQIRRELREFSPDVTIDVQGLMRSAVAARLSGARRRIGFGCEKGRERSPWLNNELVHSTSAHIIDANLELLQPLGIQNPQVRFDLPETDEDRQAVEQILRTLNLNSPFAVINVGAGWPSKLWRMDRYAAVTRYLKQRFDLPSLVVWAGEEERAAATDVVDSGFSAVMAPDTTLRELASLCRRATLFVGSDTGPLHLAAAVGTPCVGLYGPMPAERNGPYGPQHVALQKASYQGGRHGRRKAPRTLMDAITVEDVCAACDQILDHSPNRAIQPTKSSESESPDLAR